MTSKENLKNSVLVHLQGVTGALSIEDLVEVMPKGSLKSTIARALRDLQIHGKIQKAVLPNDKKGRKMWAANGQPLVHLSSKTTVATNVIPPAVNQIGTTTGRTSSIGPNLSNGPKANSEVFVTLEQAVEHVVTEFVQKGRTFSAHEVTKLLRELTNGREYVINSITDTVHVGGKDVPRIVHDKVRDIVHELFFANKMPGYDRKDNGTYHEFTPVLPSPTVGGQPVPTTSAAAPSDYDGSPAL